MPTAGLSQLIAPPPLRTARRTPRARGRSRFAIEVAGLSTSYGAATVLQDVCLTVRHGETVALLGPNGAGKSTTLEILEGFRTRSAGCVRMLGVDPERAGRRRREDVGVVLQYGEETANVTVGEMMRHFARFYPRPKPVAEVLEAVGLGAKSSARVGGLSGGRRRRLDVAPAIVGRPRLGVPRRADGGSGPGFEAAVLGGDPLSATRGGHDRDDHAWPRPDGSATSRWRVRRWRSATARSSPTLARERHDELDRRRAGGDRPVALPGALATRVRFGLFRVGYETMAYFRSADELASTFLFPPVLLAVFAAAYSQAGPIAPGPGLAGVSVAAYYLPGVVSAGILLSGLQALAVEISRERHDGTLRRLGSSPLPCSGYLVGKFGQVLICSALQLTLVLGTAHLLLGVPLPTAPGLWVRFAWLYFLGLGTMSLLGGAWHPHVVAGVLGVWFLIGLVLAITTFHWVTPR